MTARRFALVLVVGGGLLFACTLAANIILDPEFVFGTNLFPQTVNWNERAAKLRQYKKEAPEVDGLVFGSSRANLLDGNLLARKMGVSHLLSLSVSYGMITDHLPILEYIVHDKAARGEHLRAVMLLLDPDFFGKRPWTNHNINSYLPPELSGESAIRYWWRYLTAWQYRLWRDVVRAARLAPAQPKESVPASQPPGAEPVPAAVRAPISSISENYRRSWNSVRPDFGRQTANLKRFAALCRDNGVQLVVAMSPLIRQNLNLHDPGVIDELTENVSKITPLWDFNSPPLVADEQKHWLDISHFDGTTGAMMINRMFGGNNPSAFADFGRMRGAATR
jgi:hypothetical protein